MDPGTHVFYDTGSIYIAFNNRKAGPNRKSSYRPAASSANYARKIPTIFFDDPPLPESFPENVRACAADHSQIHNHKVTSLQSHCLSRYCPFSYKQGKS